MPQAAVLTGRTIADFATNIVQVGIMIGVGVAVGFRFGGEVAEILAGIVLLLLFGYAFSWVFAFLGLTASSPEASNAYGFIIILPLTFASSAFVPVATMPSWLQSFAEVNPITFMVDATRALFLGLPAGNNVWYALAWTGGIITVFGLLSVWSYRRATAG